MSSPAPVVGVEPMLAPRTPPAEVRVTGSPQTVALGLLGSSAGVQVTPQ